MKLAFTKMHGQGNDFVMLNAIAQKEAAQLNATQIRHIADRHFGVGCDQVLLVEASQRPDADFKYRIFNADGGEVEQCGNGARCFARFVRDEGLTTKDEIRVETRAGMIVLHVEADGKVAVNMGKPRFDPAPDFFTGDAALRHTLNVAEQEISVGLVSMGNPHAVQLCDNIDTAEVTRLGPLIEHHPLFPRRVNAGFMQIVDRRHIRLRVWERGAGETLACGTGACAAVVCGIRWGLLDRVVNVTVPGGELGIEWPSDAVPVTLTGAATTVFRSEIEFNHP